ncbi:hypothetical protein [Ruegeria lacuscaerulensis]|uniref:hypothetical protein n=1 Tax=Ruegeria lacuscaerulensis TaxID=55218 RepID=UPI00147FBAE3|nr:hypothetical protein [Ruegeria lacuscaerulensis]
MACLIVQIRCGPGTTNKAAEQIGRDDLFPRYSEVINDGIKAINSDMLAQGHAQ